MKNGPNIVKTHKMLLFHFVRIEQLFRTDITKLYFKRKVQYRIG